jgi:hypothetical protein
LTGMLPAGPVRKDVVEGSYLKMANFPSWLRSTAERQNTRPEGRRGFISSVFHQC